VFLGSVFDGGAIPSDVPKVFLTHPFSVSVTAEGDEAAATVAVGSETVPVLVLGPGVPVAGDRLVARQVDGIWVGWHPAMGGYPSTPCVPCAIPKRDLNLSLTYRNDALFGTATVAIPLRYVPAGTCPGGIQTPDGLVTGTDYWLADDGDPICATVGGLHGYYPIPDYRDASSAGHPIGADHYFLLSCRAFGGGGTNQVTLTHYIPRLFGGPIRGDYFMTSAVNGHSCDPFLFDDQKALTSNTPGDRVIVSVL